MIVASMATVATAKEAKLRGVTSGQSATAAMHAGVAALSEMRSEIMCQPHASRWGAE
jgi:hypothetical protein